jgi:protein O-mannosyl-transferase
MRKAPGKRLRNEPGNPLRPEWIAVSSIVLVSVLVYLRTAWFDYTFDDWIIVARNPAVQAWVGLKSIFSSAYWPGSQRGLYRPVTILTFALERIVHGGGAGGFHFVNVMLHATVSVLVYRVALHVLRARWAAAFTALLFAAHPIHIEAVAGVVGRAELLSSLFALGTILVWMRYTDGQSASPGLPAIAVLFALGASSKENVTVVPAVIAAWEFSRRTGESILPRVVRLARDPRVWVLGGSAAASFGLRTLAMGGLGRIIGSRAPYIENPLAYQPTFVRIVSAAANQVHGAVLHVFPHPLLPDYSYSTLPIRSSWLDPYFLTAIVLVAGAAVLWFVKDNTARQLAFAGAWYIIAVAPTANVAMPIGTVFGERLFYFPSIGFCLAAAALVKRAAVSFVAGDAAVTSLGKPVLAALALPVLALSAVTSFHLPVWRSDLALFLDAADSAPRNVKVRLWLGDALVRDGNNSGAIAEYRQALEIRPDYAAAAANLMVPLMDQKRYAEAIETGEAARRYFGSTQENAVLMVNLASCYEEIGDELRFLEAIERALQLAPDSSQAHYHMGRYFIRHGDKAQAFEHFRESLRLDPTLPQAPLIRKYLSQ